MEEYLTSSLPREAILLIFPVDCLQFWQTQTKITFWFSMLPGSPDFIQHLPLRLKWSRCGQATEHDKDEAMSLS